MTTIQCQKCGKPTGPAWGLCATCVQAENNASLMLAVQTRLGTDSRLGATRE